MTTIYYLYYIAELLSIYGYNCLDDIANINDEDIEDIEKQIRDGNFNGVVDISFKVNRPKYFGSESLVHSQFSFAKLTKKKVLAAAAKAATIKEMK